jgi:hypothetical protein
MDDDGDGGGGGFLDALTAKVGPLPLYLWLIIVTALALIYVQFYKGKSGAPTEEDTGTADSVPSEDVPQFVINNQLAPYAPVLTPMPVNVDVDVTSPTTSTPSTGTTTVPTKPATKYRTVKVVKYTTKNPPWNSTISGIAAHYGVKNWSTVWNNPKNAKLKALRGKPNLIRPGDTVYVPY